MHGGARRLLQLLEERGGPSRPRVTKSQRDAMQTLSSEPLRREHDNPPDDRPPDGAVAMLVRTQAQDEHTSDGATEASDAAEAADQGGEG